VPYRSAYEVVFHEEALYQAGTFTFTFIANRHRDHQSS